MLKIFEKIFERAIKFQVNSPHFHPNVFLYTRDYFTKPKKKLKMAAPKVTFYRPKLIPPFSLLKVMTRFRFQKG